MAKQTRTLPTFFNGEKLCGGIKEEKRRKGRRDKVRSRTGEDPVDSQSVGHIWGKKAWSKASV